MSSNIDRYLDDLDLIGVEARKAAPHLPELSEDLGESWDLFATAIRGIYEASRGILAASDAPSPAILAASAMYVNLHNAAHAFEEYASLDEIGVEAPARDAEEG